MKQSQGGIPAGKTIIEVQGLHSNDFNDGHCGYCNGKKKIHGSVKWGLRSNKMTVQDYQVLMDRMWRRCGTYYYKYDLTQSCCQPYSIRLDVNEYQISHAQRKVMKKFNKFLKGQIDMNGKKVQSEEEKKKEDKMQIDQDKLSEIKESQEKEKREIVEIVAKELRNTYFSKISDQDLQNIIKTSIIGKPKDKELQSTKSWATNCLIRLFFKNCEINKEKGNIGEFVEALKNNKQLTFHQKIKQYETQFENNGYLTFINKEKDETLDEKKKVQGQKQKKQKPNKNEEEKKEQNQNKMDQSSDNLNYRQYFNEIVPLELKEGEQIKHRYTVTITRAVHDKTSFEIFKKYQERVHDDHDKSVLGYKNFLCQNPLFDPRDEKESKKDAGRKELDDDRDKKDEGVWPEYLGGYHMLHKIDGETFAVGVIDLTDIALSSVYLFYDPKYEFLSPGTFAAVREIEYVRKIQEYFSAEFKYYYMGLYFQDCQKSVYKGTYKPSQVVCPITYNFVYLTPEVREKIDKEALPTLSDQPRIKPMDLTPQQVNTLVKNFKFYYKKQQIMTIEDLMPQYRNQISETVKSCYENIGLDIILKVVFNL